MGRTRGIQTLKGTLQTGTPKTTCGKTMRMTAVWETRKQQMPARGTRELLEKRRESDEQRVGEPFGKVMRVELVGCKHEGEHNLEKEEGGGKKQGGGGKRGNWKRRGIENTLRGKDPEGDNQGLGEPVREEQKRGWRDGRKRGTTIWGKSRGAVRGAGGWRL